MLALLGHLINQGMVHELLLLQILTILLNWDHADLVVGGRCSGVHVHCGQTPDRGESCWCSCSDGMVSGIVIRGTHWLVGTILCQNSIDNQTR